MANEKRLIDFEKAREAVMEILAGRVSTVVSIKVSAAMQKAAVDAVEVVHGRWVHKGAWHIECSECKHVLAHIDEAKNYCPNCGAKMDGDGNA